MQLVFDVEYLTLAPVLFRSHLTALKGAARFLPPEPLSPRTNFSDENSPLKQEGHFCRQSLVRVMSTDGTLAAALGCFCQPRKHTLVTAKLRNWEI